MKKAPAGETSQRLVLSGYLSSWTRPLCPGWAIGARMSSGQQRFPAYVSERRKAAAGTHNMHARLRQLRDAPGQTARYA